MLVIGGFFILAMSSTKKYKKRKKWSPEDMAAAVQAVRDKKMGYLKAAKTYNVPRTTVFRLANQKELTMPEILSKKIGRKPVFDKAFEDMLVKYALTMEDKLYGLTQMDMRRIAYQLAVRNNLSNPFKDEKAGRYWLKGFLSRHKHILSMRKPTGTSFARANGFTKERMEEFYDNLEKVYDAKQFTADRIFNVDETGLSIVQSKYPKVISRRGKRQIGAITSAERGSLITIVTCMSPAGIYVPPMMIFPRKNMSEILMKGAPLGSIGRAHPSGWIQTHLFTQWFQHFIDYVKPSEASPVLLLFDGHFSHTKNLEIIDKARENHVTLISLPPHCTHKIQPMDKSFMGPLKTYYSEEIRVWLRENNRPLTAYDIAELFGKAYRKCQTGEIAAKGFSVGGIYPFNRFAFTESDYLTAAHDLEQDQSNICEPPDKSAPITEPLRLSTNYQQDKIETPNLSPSILQPESPCDILINNKELTNTLTLLLEQDQPDVSEPAGQSAPISKSHRVSINYHSAGIETPSLSPTKPPLSQNQHLTDKTSVTQKVQHELVHLRDLEVNEVHSMLEEKENRPGPSHSGSVTTPFDISPVPTARKRTSNRGRKLGKSEIISSSPYKTALEEAEKRKTEKLNKISKNEDQDVNKDQGKRKRQGKGKEKSKGKEKKINEGKEQEKKKGKIKAKKIDENEIRKTATKRKILQEENTDSDSDATFISDKSEEELHMGGRVKQPTGDDCACFFCNGQYADDRRGEEWVQCFMCEGWVHSECAGYDSGCYVCDFCK